MGHLNQDTFICIDCETTGLDVNLDSIIEVAVVKFAGGEIVESFETLVNPQVPIPEASIAIHHITQEMVEGKPRVDAVLPEILSRIGEYTIVGHGVGFDIDMLKAAAKRYNIPCLLHKNQILDTLRMARLYGGSAVNSLSQLRQHFNIPAHDTHRAMGDVMVNIALFRQLIKNHTTTEKLLDQLKKPILMPIMPLGKHKGRPIKDLPLMYLQWAVRLDFDQDLIYSLQHEIRRRKQGNQFSQASNPFGNLQL